MISKYYNILHNIQFQRYACAVAYACKACEYKGCYYCCKCACFPSMAKVHLQNQKPVMMSELKIGDLIQTGTQFRNGLPYYPLFKIKK